MALTTAEFDCVRELLNHRADEDYAKRVSKHVDAIDHAQRAAEKMQRLFPDLQLSPYMNSAIKNMPSPVEADEQAFRAA